MRRVSVTAPGSSLMIRVDEVLVCSERVEKLRRERNQEKVM